MISRCAFSVFDLLYLHGSLLAVLAVASVRACCALLACSCLNALSIVHALHFLDARERSEQPLVFRFESTYVRGSHRYRWICECAFVLGFSIRFDVI